MEVNTTLNDTGVWEIWIDDLDGELAMDKNDMAVAKIEVVEKSVFDQVVKERDELKLEKHYNFEGVGMHYRGKIDRLQSKLAAAEKCLISLRYEINGNPDDSPDHEVIQNAKIDDVLKKLQEG